MIINDNENIIPNQMERDYSERGVELFMQIGTYLLREKQRGNIASHMRLEEIEYQWVRNGRLKSTRIEYGPQSDDITEMHWRELNTCPHLPTTSDWEHEFSKEYVFFHTGDTGPESYRIIYRFPSAMSFLADKIGRDQT